MPLAFGVKVALCVSPNPAQIGEFVEKYHPDYIICGTAQAENMVIALENKKIDLSNLAFFGVGGDALSLALENRVNDFLKKHHRLFADFRQTVFLYPHIKKGGHALWQNRKPSSS